MLKFEMQSVLFALYLAGWCKSKGISCSADIRKVPVFEKDFPKAVFCGKLHCGFVYSP
ncbi:MAG: hypothetical protein LBQ13_01625 [Endomicrobium sp.]|jgi:hypothetical protein|nr:hypothetical protein [Endomicrobium sp.]